MAVYKSVKGVGKTKSSLYNILKYVGSQNEKEKDDRVYKTTGINVSDDYKKLEICSSYYLSSSSL